MRKSLFSLVAVLALIGCSRKEEPVSAPVPEGESVTVIAGFGEEDGTRSRIRLEGSAVKVLWTAGDSFESLYAKNGSYYKVVFRTTDDGVSEASFRSSSIQDGAGPFYCIYPAVTYWSPYNGDVVFGVNLPEEQTAVAGGIEEGLNRAFAYSEQLTQNLDGRLTFHNIPALLKFRLSGAVVPEVKQIVLTGSGVLAGDLVFQRQDGTLVELPGIHFDNTSGSSKVTLKGDFEAGKDYYIAVWPRKLTWFQMEFSDGKGKSTLKRSGKALTFERSRTKDFGTIDLGDAFQDSSASYEPVQYMKATAGTKPVTIAVIPEGFTDGEMDRYETLAKSGINTLFGTEPYKTYADRFNVYILKVASRESGASISDGNGTITTPVRSYFGAYWGKDDYNDMRADDSVVFDYVSDHCPDIVNGIHTIAEVPIVMIINETRFGGRCWNYSNGQSYGMVPVSYGGEAIRWSFPSIVPTTDDPLPKPVTQEMLGQYCRSTSQAEYAEVGSNVGDWRNTLVHEFGGHAFGRLGDEYWPNTTFNYVEGPIDGHSWPVPYSLNVAVDPTAVPWQDDLMANRESLVARDAHYGRIGIFQGAANCIYGRWRSEMISCMIDNRCYFSAWQRYLITRRIFELSGDAASFSYAAWLAKDVTTDPVRDVAGSGVMGRESVHGPVHEAGPLPPPGLVVVD